MCFHRYAKLTKNSDLLNLGLLVKTHILALPDPIFIILKAGIHQFDVPINPRGSRSPLGTIILRKMQKVLDKSPITYKGLRCHKFCLTTIEYSRDMCPKSPKKCQSLH